MKLLELQDAIDATDGSPLYEYRMELSRFTRQKEIGRVRVVTASPLEHLKNRLDEIWDQADGLGILIPDAWSWSECDHKEVHIEPGRKISKRCKYTAEMEFGK